MPDGGFLISLTDVTAQRESAKTLARTNEVLERRVADRTLELQSAMETAKRANASKSRFVAAASHDVLQPLSAAKLFLASIDKTALPDQIDTVINKTQDALNSVEGILGALLELSKLEIDENALDVGHIGLGPIFLRMANEFAPSAAAKGLKFSLVPCQSVVRTDAEFLQRILRNLISNAIRYTEQGRILIGARRVGCNLRIEVHDTGSGIPLDEQTAIFREFYRSGTAASAAQGIGLGLAIVERACQRLGHPLGLRSEVGKGTVFHFTLPLSDGASRAELNRNPLGSEPKLAEGLVVMIVEHDEAHRRALSLFLEKWNVSALAVGSADEAERLLHDIQITPDSFLVGYQLDKKADGLELASRLKARFGNIPIGILSANRSSNLTDRCKKAGLTVLHKPIEPSALGVFLQTLSPTLNGYVF
jgi:signal transduction histidine kinase/CheY-like chemotaxis protein